MAELSLSWPRGACPQALQSSQLRRVSRGSRPMRARTNCTIPEDLAVVAWEMLLYTPHLPPLHSSLQQ
eukprot:3987002-Pyramimonas_sp.AAC.1